MSKHMESNKEWKKKIIIADFQLFLLAIIWGAGFSAGKIALETTTPFHQIAFRYAGAALFLLPLALPRLGSLNKRTLFTGIGIGALMFFGNCFQTVGLLYTTPAKQSFIVSSYTILVPLLSWLFWREKPGKQTIFAALLAMIGIAVLTLNKDLTIQIGDLLTMVFAFGFSVQVILTGRFVKDLDIKLYTFLTLASATVFSAIGALLFEQPLPLSSISRESWTAMAYLAFFNTAIAFFLQNSAQRYAPATHTALIMSLETVFGTIFAVLLVGETFGVQKALGCALMFTAILLAKLPIPKALLPFCGTTDTTSLSESETKPEPKSSEPRT